MYEVNVTRMVAGVVKGNCIVKEGAGRVFLYSTSGLVKHRGGEGEERK